MSTASNVIAQTDRHAGRHTDTTKTLPLPHTREVKIYKEMHSAYKFRTVSPGSKLQGTILLVKGKVGDVELAGSLDSNRGNPRDVTIAVNHSHSLVDVSKSR